MVGNHLYSQSIESIAFNSSVKLVIAGFAVLGLTVWAHQSSTETNLRLRTPRVIDASGRVSTREAHQVHQKARVRANAVTHVAGSRNVGDSEDRSPGEPLGLKPMDELKAWARAHRAPIIYGQKFSVQTGPYAQLVLAKSALNSRCMSQIVKAAYKLHSAFSDYTFVIDSQIQHCQNLSDGLKLMIAEKSKVEKNLNTFNSPMHSIFLTNRSRFNHYAVGEMGLHVDVNSDGEIQRRLVDFKIKEPAIPHESGPGKISRL